MSTQTLELNREQTMQVHDAQQTEIEAHQATLQTYRDGSLGDSASSRFLERSIESLRVIQRKLA